MKLFNYTIVLFLISSTFSCNKDEAPLADEKYSFKITGVTESMNAEFIDYGSKVKANPNGLLITIIAVGETEYTYQNSFSNGIPDPIFIPELPANDYNLYLKNGQEWQPQLYNKIWSIDFTLSPIYAKHQQFSLIQNGQEVNVEMLNVSCGMIFKFVDGQSLDQGLYSTLNIKVGFKGDQNYNFETQLYDGTGTFNKTIDLPAPVGENERYTIKTDITKIDLELLDLSGAIVKNVPIIFDPIISLDINDRITFNIDIEKLINEAPAGNSIIYTLSPITWNETSVIVP